MPSTSFHGIVRPCVTAILILGCFGILCFAYFKMPTTWLSNQVKLKAPAPMVKNFGSKKEQNQTVILIWMWPFGSAFALTSCSALLNIDGCHLTSDRNMLSKSHGVIFHHRDIRSDLSNLPPPQRPIFQKWVWMNIESPTNSGKIPGLNSLFNLTLNYRQDADIPVRYATIVQTQDNNFKIPSKDKLVCWIVSNWNPSYKRVAYYNALKQLIDIHVYGRAFGKPVSNQDFDPTIASCKFYLSFENSIHKDYITEKLYNPLSVGTVPIVLGPSRQNYENFVPGDAFIHVDDFPSPKELADHILILDKNEDQYHRYFEWRRHFKVDKTGAFIIGTCLACNYIRTHRNEYKVINNLNTWYWG
ncbi:4-galactosyl-N-acetylglucosaminide 3-alpha-L-fucosyltransferase 9-like [Anguilla anguilla]|uniref:4-galactosyl-N-acetylglucosaminide 3-alpha-L-fucosyltransferase 9-like n=1 Tax=Anguilla anguilla TaxID=7936 RepID=UPI0015B06B9E|nr:4-galactosyl-N-acetylglucosaminide 3-alpha-L-fucosyltransferase 9-like [Anguilla anguilla]XP_035277052.1 4-galactosyl-N-acetylglucosaminide 3-alpha-L-fucosyltransferase 9-like [Anguilla anguilla]